MLHCRIAVWLYKGKRSKPCTDTWYRTWNAKWKQNYSVSSFIHNLQYLIQNKNHKKNTSVSATIPSPPLIHPPVKSLLIKGIILPPLSCFGLILRFWLGPGNMKRNGNTWDLYNVHILSKDLKYLQSRLQIWEITTQWKPESWTNAGWVAWGVKSLG